MPVQDQHQRTATVITEPPWPSFVIDKWNVGEYVTLADPVLAGHAGIPHGASMPRRNVG
jgi:hypothetical protein